MKTQQSLFKVAFLVIMAVVACSNVWAVSYDIKEMTPDVKAALDARRGRFDELVSLKAKGKVGENNHGYVEVLSSGDGAQAIVDAENRDRKTIYNTIVTQNGLPSVALSTVEKVFAQVQRDKAASGDSIQDESGVWNKK